MIGISRDHPKMAATKRLSKELEDMRKKNNKHFKEIQVNDQNMLEWNGLLLPSGDAFGEGAFRVKLEFPAEYPFKPPKITFQTKIYHPNIDEKGQVCLPIISTENWKPATKTDQVIESLINLVQEPEPEHPLRADIAEEFNRDQKIFIRKAKEYTKKHSEKRPAA